MKNKKLNIGQVCMVGDGAHASIERVDEGIPYLSSKNFNKNGINLQHVDGMARLDIQGIYPYYGAAKVIDRINTFIFDFYRKIRCS